MCVDQTSRGGSEDSGAVCATRVSPEATQGRRENEGHYRHGSGELRIYMYIVSLL